MELDKMSSGIESPSGSSTDLMHESDADRGHEDFGETTDVESSDSGIQESIVAAGEILVQKIHCQYEVMKLAGFLSSGFDPKDTRPESDAEINAAMTLWCQNINGVKETSNAAVFDREYAAIMQDKGKSGILKNTDPDNQNARNSILQAIADKLISKQHLVN